MKKLLGILVLGLLWCNISIANDYNWKKVAKQNTPNIKLYLGPDLIDKEKKSLYEQLVANIKVVTSPDGITKNDDNYFLIDGCRPHACSNKGVVWIDKKKDIFIGVIVHKLFEDEKEDDLDWFDKPVDYLIFTNSVGSFSEVPKKFIIDFKNLEEEKKEYGYGKPVKIRFIGPDKSIKDVTIEFLKKAVGYYEKVTYDWFKDYNKFDNVNRFFINKSFVNFIEDNITSKKLSIGMSRGEKIPIFNSFFGVLGGPPGKVIYSDNSRYIFTSGCRQHSCDEKGVLFIDTQEKLTIGLIRHFYFNKVREHNDGAYLIFSKSHKSFEEIPRVFIQKVKEWVFTSHANKSPKIVRFIGADDKIIDVTKKYEELILLSQRPILKCSYVVAGETKSVVHDFNRFDAYPVYEMTNSEIKWEYPQLQNEVQFIVKSKFNRTTGLIETEVTQKGESKGTIVSGMCDKEVAHVDTATEETEDVKVEATTEETEESTLYLANRDLIYEYNEKLLNKKLSIKEIVKICKEYESKNINAAEYDQMTLNIDIGTHSYCTTTKMRNEFKQESKYNLVRDLDIEKFNFNYFTNEDYTISIPVSEITKSSSCFVNLKEEKSISYFEIKERCGVKKFITKELSNVCPATGCVLSTYEWTEDSELKNNRIRIIDYFYADANKDDYMDLIIRLKPVGGGSMGENTETIVVTSLSKGEFININYKK